jgi:colicin import membrane protein
MQITADTHDLKPPRPGRWLGPVGLALVAHALLMGALTWGVHWQKDEPLVSFEAELWSSVPREAAPRAVQPPPPPPEPEKRPEPKPEPRPVPPPPPAVKEAEIATAQAKKKAEAEKQELAKKAEAKRKAELEKEKEAKKKAAEKLAQEKKAEERKEKLAEQKKQEQERKAAERRRDEQLTAKLRADQMARLMGQAGATGAADARGSAAQSSGPSSGYAGRVQARIRPNIIYQQDFPASLRTEVEVRAAPDGTITGRRVVKSSGNSAWDDAALRAIDRTGSLPRDVDGRVPSPLILSMRPLD